MRLNWTCQCCGKQYDSLPLAYALDEPDPWRALPDVERFSRGVLSTDGCVIDGEQFCVRARLEIPLIGSSNNFVWGIWVSISHAGFDKIGELWETENRDHEPPIPGRLCSDIPIYPPTTKLECTLHLKNARRRPSIQLAASDHPLAIEQRDGITLERVKDIAAKIQQHTPQPIA
jgi:hypothetical protein